MQPALSGSLLQWGRVSDPTAALSGSQIKATGFAGGYLLNHVEIQLVGQPIRGPTDESELVLVR